ncbi:flagellar basal body L-ring protein [Thioflavicoccus mobilis 8321]|uniref:Flagellar L-ring protein n=1 Tax=Thioflavicoccus mobilis 8321 TaxID=765912 RepID=L0H3J0_9GAMM|nr:flagellar basal body L-ring protein FlgH [Thioflavicoccus mobilis]AGA92159.1 flagellar basal body L-ring protein [Thioflavicoccus mobilis 8321]
MLIASKRAAICFAATLCLFAVGCASQPKPGDDPTYLATPPPAASTANATPVTGSLYHVSSGMRLFENSVARQVGDILTITLAERTDAKKKAGTDVSKDSSVNASAALDASGLKVSPWSVGLDNVGDREFDGLGESAQSNSLQGNISVVVSEVLPNGNLVVRGEKWLALNEGKEYIRISGIVRPEDISPANTVSSLLVADARISYGGTGPIADANKLGWLTRFFISAVFPF